MGLDTLRVQPLGDATETRLHCGRHVVHRLGQIASIVYTDSYISRRVKRFCWHLDSVEQLDCQESAGQLAGRKGQESGFYGSPRKPLIRLGSVPRKPPFWVNIEGTDLPTRHLPATLAESLIYW